MGRTVYHQSCLNKFDFCNYAWYLGEVEKKRGLTNMYRCRGHGCHKAREINLKQKVRTGKDLPLNMLQDAARDVIKKQVMGDELDMQGPGVAGKSKKAAAGFIIDSTVKIVRVDLQNLQRHIKPLHVETQRVVKLSAWPFDLQMTIDAIDVNNFIIDLKSAKVRWDLAKANDQYQPKVYKLGYKGTFGTWPPGFKYHILTCTPKKHIVSAYELMVNPSEKEILAVLQRFGSMHRCIQAGIFAPTHQSNWKCSREWCDYYSHCKYVGN